MIQSIAFFVYPVRDLAKSREFYEQVLGLKLETNFGDKWVEYDIGGSTFAVTNVDMGRQPGGKGGTIALEVDDLDATVAVLKAKGVSFDLEITPSPVCRFAVIADPDGNQLMIHKRHA